MVSLLRGRALKLSSCSRTLLPAYMMSFWTSWKRLSLTPCLRTVLWKNDSTSTRASAAWQNLWSISGLQPPQHAGQNPHFKAEPELTSVFTVLRPGVSLLPVLWDQTSLPTGSFGGTGGLLSLSPDYCFKSRVATTKLPLHALINSGIEQNLIESEPAKQIGL